ncbi:hypothetical protein T484DRAFT_1848270 [Baffinella frigidus]|nr:hypothetical protein T484DRAFT_1848270 [Cryptophyta sp. CCMP2293]
MKSGARRMSLSTDIALLSMKSGARRMSLSTDRALISMKSRMSLSNKLRRTHTQGTDADSTDVPELEEEACAETDSKEDAAARKAGQDTAARNELARVRRWSTLSSNELATEFMRNLTSAPILGGVCHMFLDPNAEVKRIRPLPSLCGNRDSLRASTTARNVLKSALRNLRRETVEGPSSFEPKPPSPKADSAEPSPPATPPVTPREVAVPG